MRQLKKYNLIQKIIALLVILLILSTAIVTKPIYADNVETGMADSGPTNEEIQEEIYEGEQNLWTVGGELFRPISSLLCGLGDAVNKILQKFIIGSSFLKDEILIDSDTFDVIEQNKVTQALDSGEFKLIDGPTKYIVKDYIDSWTGNYFIPNFKLTPAEIFAGNVSALDANFFKTTDTQDQELGGSDKSIVNKLTSVVSQWYVALRNIAIVGLLSVLLYIGIRIVISSSAGDKAKYKQFFVDWVVALCLIFFLHYIMAFTMTISETITDALAGENAEHGAIKQLNVVYINKDGTVFEDAEHSFIFDLGEKSKVAFSTNFTGLARIKAQHSNSLLSMGYTIMYCALTFYTMYFTFIYLKRLLYLAFFTMIAPLVALTYPIDKMKDGKAQAFNFWFKEYMFYALLQPIHMLLYRVFVLSALDLASSNLIYAIVALAFIVPAEKIVKQMFGIKGNTESALGGFAGGALAAKAFDVLKKGKGGNNGKANASTQNNNKIRQAKNPNSPDAMGTLADDAMGQTTPEIGTRAPGGPSAADAYQNSPDPVRAAEKEALEEKIADGQINESELTDEQKALLGMNSTSPQTDTQTPDSTPPVTGDQFGNRKKKISNNFKRAVNRRYVRAGGLKGIGKAALKGYGKALGIVGMGAIGLSAGIVGGDLDDTWKGMAAGMAAGSVVSKRTNQKLENAFSANGAIGGFINEVRYGDGYAEKEFKKQYINSQANRERILDKNPDMELKEINAQLKSEAEMSYDTGISDYSTIEAAIKMEKSGVSHDRAVAIAKLSQNYDNSTFTDQSKYNAAQQRLSKQLAEKIKNNAGGQLSGEEISKRARAEASKTLEQIRQMKKIL